MADSRSELSMDEILSSIKKIIADEDRAKPTVARKAIKPTADLTSSPVADAAPSDAILELTQLDEPASEGAETREIADLLDDNKARSLRHSFSTLQTLAEPGVAPQIVRSGETSLEGLTRDLLRPMLKDWLDSNLPGIVEAMVEREIARITKKD
jgi:cell pole-organizing protein PopZ